MVCANFQCFHDMMLMKIIEYDKVTGELVKYCEFIPITYLKVFHFVNPNVQLKTDSGENYLCRGKS